MPDKENGVDLPPPKQGAVPENTRRSAESAYQAGQDGGHPTSPKRARAVKAAQTRAAHRN